MKEKILELRNLGLSYNAIVDELGCAKSTVAYHCNPKNKEKTRERLMNRKQRKIEKKIWHFTTDQTSKIRQKTGEFARNNTHTGQSTQKFSYKDVIDKFGKTTVCYLTGRKIDLIDGDYAFDHIVPRSKGGSLSIDNLGITDKSANSAKSDLSVDEFIQLCKDVLINFGYEIIAGSSGEPLVS